jgi:tetratricopeptide (TPR) repeat protein
VAAQPRSGGGDFGTLFRCCVFRRAGARRVVHWGRVTAYPIREAARILGISPARLARWERSALVRPSAIVDARPAYGFRDLVCVKTILLLLDHGVPLRRIRRTVEAVRERIPELDEPIARMRVWLDGSDRVVVRHGEALYEPDGQQVIDFALSPERGEDVAPLARPAAPDAESALEWFERGCRLDASPATFAEAIEAYRHAIEADPDFADAHCNLGAIHHQMDRREEARACYQRALGCDPRHVEANLNLASLLEEDDRPEAALGHYKAALKADPLRAETNLAMALLYERLGLRRRARDHWRRYLQSAPSGPWAETARKRMEEGE